MSIEGRRGAPICWPVASRAAQMLGGFLLQDNHTVTLCLFVLTVCILYGSLCRSLFVCLPFILPDFYCLLAYKSVLFSLPDIFCQSSSTVSFTVQNVCPFHQTIYERCYLTQYTNLHIIQSGCFSDRNVIIT